jgi:hypothetical protein
MNIISTFKLFAASALALALSAGSASAQAYSEDFVDITTLTAGGWFMQNNSTTIGTTNWFQGNTTVFNAQNGATTSYIGANYNNTTGANTISNWLLTPVRTLKNGDVFTFYTRKSSPDDYADRLEVRMSTNGSSNNVGTGATAVGDFTTLLLSINPTLVTGVYPTAWTQYTITVSGLPAPTSGRFAFRYFVTNGGPSGLNSDYIGIDNVVYTPYVCPTLTISPSSLPNGTAGTAYSQSLSQTGALGAYAYAVSAFSLPPGLTLSTSGVISGTPTATGTFPFGITLIDASGCNTTQSYNVTISCPANAATLSLAPVCSNAAPVTLAGGSPAGGTYSGTGVSSGMFDPSVGTQTLTYTYTDPYGCVHTASSAQTVNPAPVVTLSSFTAVCDNSGMAMLSGGAPAGGTYSGTGVSAGMFDPSAGSQTITYTYSNGTCSNTASQLFTVNTSPVATLASFTAVCDNSGMVMLSGGAPAGGTYSGTGVSAGMFDPSVGTQTISYMYSDGTCSDTASQVFTVNPAPVVAMTPFASVSCVNDPAFALNGGSPAGGTYSGTNVSGGMYDPITAGTFVVTYTYSDGTCAASDTASITVDVCTGLSAIAGNANVEIYPNPANGIVTVRFIQENGSGKLVAKIVDVHGKLIVKEEQDFNGSFEKAFDLSNVSAGVYFIEISSDKGNVRSKLIVK